LNYSILFSFTIATSALDNESEKIVQEALDRAAKGILYQKSLPFYSFVFFHQQVEQH
jgi:hypothetical protein